MEIEARETLETLKNLITGISSKNKYFLATLTLTSGIGQIVDILLFRFQYQKNPLLYIPSGFAFDHRGHQNSISWFTAALHGKGETLPMILSYNQFFLLIVFFLVFASSYGAMALIDTGLDNASRALTIRPCAKNQLVTTKYLAAH